MHKWQTDLASVHETAHLGSVDTSSNLLLCYVSHFAFGWYVALIHLRRSVAAAERWEVGHSSDQSYKPRWKV